MTAGLAPFHGGIPEQAPGRRRPRREPVAYLSPAFPGPFPAYRIFSIPTFWGLSPHFS